MRQSSIFQIKKHIQTLDADLYPQTYSELCCIFLAVAGYKFLCQILQIFSPFLWVVISLLMVSFEVKFFSFCCSPIYFSFCYAFSVISKKSLPSSTSLRFTPLFCSKSFTVLLLKCSSHYDPF